MNAPRIFSRHDDVGGHDREAEAVVIVRVAHEENEVPAEIRRAREALEDERATDPDRATLGIGRHRSQQQSRPMIQPHRPIADRAHDPSRFLGHEAQFANRRDSRPIAIRDLAVSIGTEGEIEKRFDRVAVSRSFEPEVEHGNGALARKGSGSGEPPEATSEARASTREAVKRPGAPVVDRVRCPPIRAGSTYSVA
ncbi:MAG: hypothetical protein N2038_09165 [Geminicoccaceae bacterium]|nr:hypothetical protein [Geminicoccaceae bacterium]MCX7630407.1 hypothetical protein [Geminicoccaceae bacterium]MDW8123172.1 hypothetical protein [Geminicoccaceae bacterium]